MKTFAKSSPLWHNAGAERSTELQNEDRGPPEGDGPNKKRARTPTVESHWEAREGKDYEG